MNNLRTKTKRITNRTKRTTHRNKRKNPDQDVFKIELSLIHGARIIHIFEGFLYVYDPQVKRFIKQESYTEYTLPKYRADKESGLFKLLPLLDPFYSAKFKKIWQDSYAYDRKMKELRLQQQAERGILRRSRY